MKNVFGDKINLRAAICIVVLSSFAGTGVAAQSVVGRGVVAGRNVELFQDGTWRYEQASVGTCRNVSRDVRFCGSDEIWIPLPQVNKELDALYRFDDQRAGFFVYESTGSIAGMSMEVMHKTIIAGAANAGGILPEDVVILDEASSVIDGKETHKLVYTVDISGLGFAYSNSVLIAEGFTLQAVTYTVGREDNAELQKFHASFLNLIEIVE